MTEAHVNTRSPTPHPPGSFIQTQRVHKEEPDEHIRAQNARFLVPTEIVCLMGLAGFILSILAMVTPLKCYIRPCFIYRSVPMTPSYYFAHNRPLSSQRPASPRRRPSSSSTLSSHSSTSTVSSILLDTPNSESSPQSILIPSHTSSLTDRKIPPPTKRVSFKEDLVHHELNPASRADHRSVSSPAPVDVWALAVMDDLLVLEKSHTKEFSRANSQKRHRLTKNLSFSSRCPTASHCPSPKLSPTPSFSSTMSDPSSNVFDSIAGETHARDRHTRKKKLFCK